MTVITSESARGGGLDALIGGKGRNLGALTAAGLPVPRWVILGSDAFEAALAAAGIGVDPGVDPGIDPGVDPGVDPGAGEAPPTLADRLRAAARAEAALRESPVPPAIRAQIETALDSLAAPAVAVRSSARQEDGSRHSFAGLFDSFLNLRGADAVEDAVRMCWASAFSPRVTHYRHARGLGFGDVALAVILQEFVEPVSSGVLFTANPVTGSRDQLLIHGVLGLGEGLVSGIVDSDSVVLDKATGAVLDESVVAKTQMVTAKVGNGVASAPVPALRQRDSAIPAGVMAELTDLASRLESRFEGPQDVEWAFDGTTTWILQTRPITTVGDAPEPEQLGETVTDGEIRIWDNSNIIESFAGVTSPLTFTVARQLYADVYRSYARSLGVPPAQLRQMESWLPVMLGQFNGRVYYNLLHWYRMVGIAPGYALNRRVLEVALGVAEPLDRGTAKALRPFVFRSLRSRVTARFGTAVAYARRFASIDAMVVDFDRSFAEFIARHGLSDVDALSGDDAYRHFRRTHTEVGELWGPMLVLDAILLTSVGLLALLAKVFLPGAPEWVGFALLSPGADTDSVEPARALTEIAAFVDAVPALRTFIDTTDPATAYDRLAGLADSAAEPHWRELYERVQIYIDRFGYRCLDELKLEAPDLRRDPAGIFHLLRMALTLESQRDVRDSAQQYLDTHLRGVRRRIFDALRGKVQRAATHREHLRFCRTRGFAIIKSLAAVMARDLEQRGILARRDDIFALRLEELLEVYEGTMPAARARAAVARRAGLDAYYRSLVAPARFTTTGSDYTAAELEAAGWRSGTDPAAAPAGDAPAGTVLTGTPSCPGTVTGRAVVVEKPEDFSNGILVAYRTEPSWAAALPFASALLIERASPLTHVAIIARELGVPTVVQIDGLTAAVRTGMTVSVDGATGRVVVVEGAPPCGT